MTNGEDVLGTKVPASHGTIEEGMAVDPAKKVLIGHWGYPGPHGGFYGS